MLLITLTYGDYTGLAQSDRFVERDLYFADVQRGVESHHLQELVIDS